MSSARQGTQLCKKQWICPTISQEKDQIMISVTLLKAWE